MLDRPALPIIELKHPTEHPVCHTMMGGLLGATSRRALMQVRLGIGLWLIGPPFVARMLGRRGLRTQQHPVERWWARRMVQHLAIQLEISGLDHIDRHESYIITPLHEGFADVLPLFHLPLNIRFAARDELFAWRMVGPVLRDTGQISIMPERGSWSYRQLLRSARTMMEHGESVVVFPQGTILGIESDFQLGAFALARSLNRPILPVVLTGSHRVWEHPYSPRLRYGQRMSMHILPSIPVTTIATLHPEDLRCMVQRQMKASALSGTFAPPRRFVPTRDGYWDGFAYRIDPDFPEVAADVASHRAGVVHAEAAPTAANGPFAPTVG